METLTIIQHVKVIEVYYENGRSYRNALRDYFCKHKQSRVSIEILFGYSNKLGRSKIKTPSRTRLYRSAENNVTVQENVTENPNALICHSARELNFTTTMLHRIFDKRFDSIPLQNLTDNRTQSYEPVQAPYIH